MSDLLVPTKPSEKSYKELVILVQNQLASKPPFKDSCFNQRSRKDRETIAE